MATKENTQSITLLAGADLSAAQFRFVKTNSAGAAVLAGAGEMANGAVQNDPESGQAALVDISGVTKVEAAAAITTGALVASDAAGKAVAATSDDYALGTAMETGAADRIISVLFQPSGVVPE
jgi:hypothetical protein